MSQHNIDENIEIYQMDMILPRENKSLSSSSSEPQVSSEQIRALFIRPIPEPPYYLERLEEELRLFEQKNLFPYLLRALEILKIAGNIPHVTRGSCGSSLVCYLLGISHVDPVKYNISFARFLNVHRNTLPDIDFDFPYHRRKDIFFRIEERYPNQVARISNHVYYHEKSALREAIRQSGYHKMIPKHEVKKYLSTLPQEERKKILEKKKELEGTFHTYSLHCGGIVYYPDGVPKDLVLNKNQPTIVQQITLNKEDVAKEKHFKIDILSSRAISVLCDILGEEKCILFEDPPHDDRVFEMLSQGDNVGITLAESPLMRKTMMKFKPKSIEDLAFCLSIIRPAAKDARNAELDEIEDQELFVYDDDAIKMIAGVLECSEGDADKFRRVFAKNDKKGIQLFQEILDEMMIQEEEKKEVMKTLGQLSFYSFCKSHAFSYAQLVYQLAYYKFHQPLLFWKAVLKHSESSYRKWVHFYEASSIGLDVSTPKRDVSIFATNRRNKIHLITSPLEQLKKYGYWVITEDHLSKFFPNCYFYPLENEFRINGIIASAKLIKRGHSYLCILYLGVGKKEYVEVVIKGLGFIHAKWVGCKVIAKAKDVNQKIFESVKYHFY
jgi:DNA polymerase III alpha subunit